MHSSYPMRSLSLLLLAVLVTVPRLVRAEVLHIDGIVRVKEGSWKGVTLTVVPEFSASFVVALSSGRFDLNLPLQATYLLRAEHAGCPTKEVLLDCTVPPAFEGVAFEFPIQIDLAVAVAGPPVAYAGPVGLVTFAGASADFTYTTDYTRIANVRSLPELYARMPATALRRGTNTDPVASAFPSPLAQASSRDRATPVKAPLPAALPAPVVAVLVVEGSLTPMPIAVVPVHVASVDSITPTLLAVAKRATPLAAAEPAPARAVVHHPKTHLPTPDDRPCGTYDLETHALCVIRIDRIHTTDGCSELRKVVHAYGAVFFFHDGRAVAEPYYQRALSAQE